MPRQEDESSAHPGRLWVHLNSLGESDNLAENMFIPSLHHILEKVFRLRCLCTWEQMFYLEAASQLECQSLLPSAPAPGGDVGTP